MDCLNIFSLTRRVYSLLGFAKALSDAIAKPIIGTFIFLNICTSLSGISEKEIQEARKAVRKARHEVFIIIRETEISINDVEEYLNPEQVLGEITDSMALEATDAAILGFGEKDAVLMIGEYTLGCWSSLKSKFYLGDVAGLEAATIVKVKRFEKAVKRLEEFRAKLRVLEHPETAKLPEHISESVRGPLEEAPIPQKSVPPPKNVPWLLKNWKLSLIGGVTIAAGGIYIFDKLIKDEDQGKQKLKDEIGLVYIGIFPEDLMPTLDSHVGDRDWVGWSNWTVLGNELHTLEKNKKYVVVVYVAGEKHSTKEVPWYELNIDPGGPGYTPWGEWWSVEDGVYMVMYDYVEYHESGDYTMKVTISPFQHSEHLVITRSLLNYNVHVGSGERVASGASTSTSKQNNMKLTQRIAQSTGISQYPIITLKNNNSSFSMNYDLYQNKPFFKFSTNLPLSKLGFITLDMTYFSEGQRSIISSIYKNFTVKSGSLLGSIYYDWTEKMFLCWSSSMNLKIYNRLCFYVNYVDAPDFSPIWSYGLRFNSEFYHVRLTKDSLSNRILVNIGLNLKY